jgi:DNA-directed RNA polymerase specialized sigma24 family protein
MIDLRTPEQLTVAELVQATRGEIQLFLRHQPAANACAFALFRRAIVERDEQAWTGLYGLYNNLVHSWIARRASDLSSETHEALVNEVFAKFYRSLGPEKFERFSDILPLLAYLKLCARSVVADYRRQRQAWQREESLEYVSQEPVADDFADSVADRLAAQEVWAVVSREVTAREERLIVVMVCAQGMSPRELQQHYPHVFASVEDIYRIKRNIMERLRRNRRLRALWSSEYQKVSAPHGTGLVPAQLAGAAARLS